MVGGGGVFEAQTADATDVTLFATTSELDALLGLDYVSMAFLCEQISENVTRLTLTKNALSLLDLEVYIAVLHTVHGQLLDLFLTQLDLLNELLQWDSHSWELHDVVDADGNEV